MTDLEKAHERRLAGDLDTAETYCQKVLAGAPETAEALSLLAVCRAERGTVDAAQARDRMPSQAAPLSALGRLYVEAGRDDLALEQVNAALAVNPRAASTLLNRSALLRKLGRIDAALADARLAIQLQPGSPDAHLQLAHGLRRAGRTDEAHGAFMGAMQRAPLRGDIHEDAANFLWSRARGIASRTRWTRCSLGSLTRAA